MRRSMLAGGFGPILAALVAGPVTALEQRALTCTLEQATRVCEALCEEGEIAVGGGCRVEPGGTLPVQALVGAGVHEPTRYTCQWAAPRQRGRTTVTTFVLCARRGVLLTPK